MSPLPMTQQRKVLVYGAGGYTGKIIAQSLAQRNIPFFMAGRGHYPTSTRPLSTIPHVP